MRINLMRQYSRKSKRSSLHNYPGESNGNRAESWSLCLKVRENLSLTLRYLKEDEFQDFGICFEVYKPLQVILGGYFNYLLLNL